jgi:hypothetical protein
MYKKYFAPVLFAAIVSVLLSSCAKETTQIDTKLISDYLPLQVGKFITYRLDSTVYVNLNTVKEVHSYVVQDLVDAAITDNLGNPSFRIRRLIRSNTDTTIWKDNASFVITPKAKSVEWIENNLRYIKLNEPIRDNFLWRGNSYINSYSNPDLQYLDNWEYIYENVGQPFNGPGLNLPETITVLQRDEILGDPDNKSFYFEINQSKEVFGKGIGLVYKNFLHEAWQPPNITSPSGYYEPNSFGITLTLLNHN